MLKRPLPEGITINSPRDPNTLSNYNNFGTTHTKAVLAIEFDQKKVSGTVFLTLKSLTHGETKNLILDTRYAANVLHVLIQFISFDLILNARLSLKYGTSSQSPVSNIVLIYLL